MSHLPPGGGGEGGTGATSTSAMGKVFGIVLYGMCSHSLYIKGEN